MKRPIALLALPVAVLVGCSTPYSPPGQHPDFPGLVTLLNESPNSPKTLDLILVHGMCTHYPRWATEAVNQLLADVGLPPTEELKPSEAFESEIRLYQHLAQVPVGELRITAILWSPLTTPLKQNLCFDQTNKSAICSAPPLPSKPPDYPYDRASLNAKVKDELLNDCLSDAIAYQGVSRNAIMGEMQRALLFAAASPGGRPLTASGSLAARSLSNPEPMVIISDSLGSKIVFDAVAALVGSFTPTIAPAEAAKAAEAGQHIVDRTAQLFMNANQLPILSLADPPSPSLKPALAPEQRFPYPTDPLSVFASARMTSKSSPRSFGPPRVVAFTDPNDLLSYLLKPSRLGKGLEVIDVPVSNDWTIFGWVENPYQAHLGYHGNRHVARLITCGKPDRCEK